MINANSFAVAHIYVLFFYGISKQNLCNFQHKMFNYY